jgi:TetR/AcrR family transcriptional regulator
MPSDKTNKKILPGRRPKTLPGKMDTRATILAAARKVFAGQGLDGTSVREVAQAAKVNNAMIYYYFKDKDDLYRSVLVDSFEAMAKIWNDSIFQSAAPVREKIQRFIEGYIRFHQGNDDLRRIMAMEFAGSGGNITWVCENFFADNFAKLTKLIRQGMRTGELRTIDPSTAAASLIGVIIHNFIMQPIAEHVHGKRKNLSPGKFGKFVTCLFFDGLGQPAQRNSNV